MAVQVYLASAAPPVRHPNVYGVDMPNRKEFVAHGLTEEQVRWRGRARAWARVCFGGLLVDVHAGACACIVGGACGACGWLGPACLWRGAGCPSGIEVGNGWRVEDEQAWW